MGSISASDSALRENVQGILFSTFLNAAWIVVLNKSGYDSSATPSVDMTVSGGPMDLGMQSGSENGARSLLQAEAFSD